jgi:putative MFS transporter
MKIPKEWKSIFTNMAVIVVALGYFVDIFDLTLFNMVRKASLESIGVPPEKTVEYGLLLLNSQMIGMLLGGIICGVLGDKKGRLSSLFASILLYSLANIANAFVTDVTTYAILRFIAGVGLAGELGVGITLVSEILPKETRGLGTALVATIGVLGAVVGGVFVEIFDWRTCYIIGGCFGLMLLFLRVKVHESNMFDDLKKENHNLQKGNLLFIIKNPERLKRMLICILIGIPIWYVAGILMPFSPEIAQELGVAGVVTSSRTIAICYLGLAFGDFFSGVLSQHFKSRRKVIFIFEVFCVFVIALLLITTKNNSTTWYYILCFLIGLGAGFWALFVMISAEQFGTNIRATIATSIPNFVRASVIPMSILLTQLKPSQGLLNATIIVGIVVFALAFIGAWFLTETFGKDLNFVETD